MALSCWWLFWAFILLILPKIITILLIFSLLVNTRLDTSLQLVLLCGFLAAFLVKLPALGFHVWLPTIFESCPIVLFSLVSWFKTGAYGILRFALPLFPDAVVL